MLDARQRILLALDSPFVVALGDHATCSVSGSLIQFQTVVGKMLDNQIADFLPVAGCAADMSWLKPGGEAAARRALSKTATRVQPVSNFPCQSARQRAWCLEATESLLRENGNIENDQKLDRAIFEHRKKLFHNNHNSPSGAEP